MKKAARAKAQARGRGQALRHELARLVRDPVLPGAIGVVALSLLDEYVWVGALISELSFLLVLVALVLALVFALRREFTRTFVLALCALFFAQDSWPYLRATRPTPVHGPTLHISQAHAHGAPLSAAQLARFLVQSNAEVLSLTGLRSEDSAHLARDLSGYRRVSEPENPTQMLWIKRSLAAPPPAKSARFLRLGRCQLELVQVDLPSLFSATTLSERRRRIADLARSRKEPRRIYIGHFGSRSDSADLAPLRGSQELRDARLGYGRLATAPDLLGPLGLPVDHVLLHGWILARSVSTEAALAANMHRTLSATLELTEPRCLPAEGSTRAPNEQPARR